MQTYLETIRLDVSSKRSPVYIYAKEDDNESRFVKVELYADGKRILPTEGDKASFRCTKPDKESCWDPAVIDQQGNIIVELTAQTLAEKGLVEADIAITNKGFTLSSATFYIKVNKSALNDDKLKSSSEFLYLIQIEDIVRALTDRAENAAVRSEDALSKVKDGLSAYEVAVKNGYKGTEQEWLESLKGVAPTVSEILAELPTWNGGVY